MAFQKRERERKCCSQLFKTTDKLQNRYNNHP